MKTYRFVGSNCVIFGVAELSKFGQRIELSEEIADNVIRGGGALIPEEEFESIGFTPDEESKYAFPGQQLAAPESFKTKLAQARRMFCIRHYELDPLSYKQEAA